ncbi:Magnesium-dependent phosphatase 1 [Echinococcus granulosus]|uniref:Magnesium dependent phosphatase 1 n=1 Tax=Echinococcus granulosus TaxID=6210 RepID=U6JGT9_ECHGR|nr:Magnesium-dependent phosphatase [Echinococcus granulosus]EUB61269.1 Magnesium-dependent phosphatase [Echinococcus granulosus]KAH9279213.1 Magnesium-dependent phosphatase 1 [Echinococcus granulosus]CDS20948.1 magnesium dependent phosphatase 1 [Echinococcus granulosus]
MVFSSLSRKPGLIVFDLDCTLWPFDCDDYYESKLYKKDGIVYDGSNVTVKPYPQSETVLRRIKEEPDVKLGVASMTSSPRVGHKLIKLFGWDKYFDYVEIYPVSKVKHFETLAKRSGLPFYQMLFFDDLSFNIREVGSLGVHAVLAPNGVDLTLLRRALEEFASITPGA